MADGTKTRDQNRSNGHRNHDRYTGGIDQGDAEKTATPDGKSQNDMGNRGSLGGPQQIDRHGVKIERNQGGRNGQGTDKAKQGEDEETV